MKIETILRRINKNRKYFLVNVFGLAIAFACTLLIYSYINNELSYDRFHSKSERIFRITQNTNTGISSMIDARIYGDWVPELKEDYSEIQDVTRISTLGNTIVTIDEDVFYSTKVYCVDSAFCNVFDFDLILGNKETLFINPNEMAITESMAKLYFGTTDIIGKKIKLESKKLSVIEDYTITAVLKDFPANTHFKADFLCSIKKSAMANSLLYTYLLLHQNADYKQIQDSIQSNLDKLFAEYSYDPIVNLQAMTDIHLYSHKSREMERNGNMRSLILLISGALIILIIAAINFTNLNYVQYLSEKGNNFIRIVNGASQLSLAKEFLQGIFVLIAFVISTALLSVYNLSDVLGLRELLLISQDYILEVIIAFVLFIIILAGLPFLYRKTNISQIQVKSKNAYKISLVLQLMLSIIAIVSTLFLNKQINYLNLLHPQAENTEMIVLPENPAKVVEKYETLKQNVLKHPEIIAVTAVMENPAGIVTDNFKFAYDSDTPDEDKTINVLTIDSNFFSFMDIKPIAGTLNMSHTSNIEWEYKALQLRQAEMNNQELPAGFKDEVLAYKDKIILNRKALEHLGIEDAQQVIGKTFRLMLMGYLFPKGEIIGVVDDFHYTNMYVEEKPLVMISRKMFCHNFLFKINPDHKSEAIAALREEWLKLFPAVPFQYEFITDSYQKVYKNEYDQMKVLLLFALISILLSAIGIYTMVSFNLKIKTKEIGVRKVNGATVFEIMKMLNIDFVKWVAIAFVFAVPISYFAMQEWLENFAYKTQLSWWIFALAGIIAMAIVLITVSWHTYRAASKNPVVALKYE